MTGPQALTDPLTPLNKWYLPTPSTFPPVALEVFKKYTNLTDEEMMPHIVAVREKAWKIFPYPCIGGFRFLDFSVSEATCYDEIVSRLKSGENFLDLGCCFGQDIRKLVSDGAPSANIYGADLIPEYISLGHELFLDKETTDATFLAPVDIFDESESSLLNDLYGKIDIIHIGSFLHLFSHADQIRAAKRISKILSPKKGSMVVGRQGGSSEPGEHSRISSILANTYRHDAATFEKFWNEEVSDGGWDVDVDFKLIEPRPDSEVEDGKGLDLADGKLGWLRFSIKRV